MFEPGAGGAMVFDFDYAHADAGSLDYSFQGLDEREHPTLLCTTGTACVFAQLCCWGNHRRRLA